MWGGLIYIIVLSVCPCHVNEHIIDGGRDEPEVIDPTLEVTPISMTQLILGAQKTCPISSQEIETLRLKNRLKVRQPI